MASEESTTSLARRIAMSSRKRKRVQNRHNCPHCDRNLVMKTFRRHEKLFKRSDGSWITAAANDEETISYENESVPNLDASEEPLIVHDACVDAPIIQNSSSSCSSESDCDNEEIWDDNESDHEACSGDTGSAIELPGPALPDFSPDDRSSRSLVSWVTGFLLNFKAKFYISDAAMNILFRFLHALFSVLGLLSPLVSLFAEKFPKSLHVSRKSIGLQYSFTKYVVCKSCWKLYSYEDAKEKCGSLVSSKKCNFVKYPDHPYISRRKPCSTILLKQVELLSGKTILYPNKIFCYKSIQETLQEFLLCPGFVEECDHWRCKTSTETLKTIYDSKVWKDYQVFNGSPFLAGPHAYALMLGIDWFQPYTHTTASVGAMYVSIMNLPRHSRYKRKNSLLIGIIPGPSEPNCYDLNHLLEPLVAELKKLWHGVPLQVNLPSGIESKEVRCALLCVACDLPAGRKVCGFLSYNATKGCSKCKKAFPGLVGSMNYSGFDRSNWVLRTNASHRRDARSTLNCRTKTARAEKESLVGCRYSILLELPYFDAPTMLAIDPMHNLFLGTGKKMISIWLEAGVIDSSKFKRIQETVDSLTVPSSVGRIPQKIETGFSGFKADQFKTWITLYSIPALFGILPSNHLECWRHFVLACRILIQHELSYTQLDLADALLIRFCKKIEELYGEHNITPNMHLHGHLKQVILDYGPVQEFWVYSYERYNGILGKQPTNNRAIEPQLMEKFLQDTSITSFSYPDDEYKSSFQEICKSVSTPTVVGSVLDTIQVRDTIRLPPKSTRSVLLAHDIETIKKHFIATNPDYCDSTITVNSIFLKYKSLHYNGKDYRTSGKRTNSPAVALTIWDKDLYGEPTTSNSITLQLPFDELRPIDIHYFMKVSINAADEIKSMLLASASWFYPHEHRFAYGKPVQLWCRNFYESYGMHSFVPIDHLSCRCAHGNVTYHDEQLLAVIPLVE